MIKTGHSRGMTGWILIAPFALTLLLFFVYALLRAVYFSFTDYNLFSDASWVGIQNFIKISTDKLFLIALFNSLIFSLIVTLLQTALALVLAMVIRGDFFGKHFFRVAFYVPSILSSASVTLVFIWFYQKNGFLNAMLSEFLAHQRLMLLFATVFAMTWLLLHFWSKMKGRPRRFTDPLNPIISGLAAFLACLPASQMQAFHGSEVSVVIGWLGTHDYWGPLPRTMWAIVIQNIYTTVPTFMLLFLAGLHGIPKELYEAAHIDGAGKWNQFVHVTLPQLAPVTFVVVTFGMIGTLQMFDQVALLGGAAPLESKITLAYYVYHNAFPPGGEPNVGMASAAALILALITLAVVYLQQLLGVREKIDD